MQSDALSTALLVMGPEAGFAFAERRQITALFISRSETGFSERMSASFARYVGERPACFCCCYYQDRGGRVSDYMTRSVITVNADTDIVAVAEMFLKGPYRCFPVVTRDRVVGMISRRETFKALWELR